MALATLQVFQKKILGVKKKKKLLAIGSAPKIFTEYFIPRSLPIELSSSVFAH
jgi:hypothetical protein